MISASAKDVCVAKVESSLHTLELTLGGAAANVDDRVTDSFRIFRASFQ
jgi:hypothetical protein